MSERKGISRRLEAAIRAVRREVAKWEPWQRSLDPYGPKKPIEQEAPHAE